MIVGGRTGIGSHVVNAIRSGHGASNTNIVTYGLDESGRFMPEIPFSVDSDFSLACHPGDVTSPASREKVVQYCVKRYGGIDTLVYCAGVITPIERIEKMNMEAVKKAFDVNVFGAMAMVLLPLSPLHFPPKKI